MNIPKKFAVGKSLFDVRMHDRLSRGMRNGITFFSINLMQLARANRRGPRKPEDIEQTFWHEAVHVILDDMGHKLYKDEKFVDQFATRLHQITKTAKF
jgi:hypothetical protein